jgi:hypothetical protein
VRLQRRAGLVCLGVGLLALGVRAALLPIFPIPLPAVHDEFSYLLGAETFLLARLANPPHPMWMHFETFHVIFQPAYASKYPPAQALFLALGWKLFGHPWYGVWLSMGLMCGTLCWSLQGWLPPRYALLGGLMAVAQWGIAGVWIGSYWGGAVAAAAGALVVGAVPRLARRPTALVGALAALGVVGLANSRPYEGAVTAGAAFVALLVWRPPGHRFKDRLAPRVIVAAAAILMGGFLAMAYYNYRVTGDPLEMPYSVYQKMYGASPVFWMMPARAAPVYRHEVIRKFFEEWDKPFYDQAHAFPPQVALVFCLGTLPFFLTPVSAAAVFAAVFLRRSRKVRMALAITAVSIAGLLLERFSVAHYFAPATALVLVLVLLGVQFLGARLGRRAVAIFAILFFAGAGFQVVRGARLPEHQEFAMHRRNTIRRLESGGGRHLVVVRYGPNHDVHEEWVFNHADIDGSSVIWARDMGEGRNRELLDYYQSRQVWLLEPDGPSPALIPYAPR